MATAWRMARALETYKAELNARWPKRDRRSDGGIGDAEHATRSSDHNPWVKASGIGVVRAWDTDKDLTGAGTDALPPEVNVEANWLADHLRALGRAGDPRLIGGGYVIWNRRIAGEIGNWAWRPYDGVNAHKHHVHLSVSRNATGFDSTAPWGIYPPPSAPDFLEDLVAQLNDAEKTEFMRFVNNYNRTWDVMQESRAPGHEGEKVWLADGLMWSEGNTSRTAAASEQLLTEQRKTNDLLAKLIAAQGSKP